MIFITAEVDCNHNISQKVSDMSSSYFILLHISSLIFEYLVLQYLKEDAAQSKKSYEEKFQSKVRTHDFI